MPDFKLHPIDITIVGIYLVFVVWFGFRIGKKHKSAEDYFLAGRSMIWPFIGISLFASNISSTTLIGLAGDAYSTGISVYNYEWFATVILVFFVIFILPFVLKSQVYTIPEYLERRYDGRARTYFSILNLFLNIMSLILILVVSSIKSNVSLANANSSLKSFDIPTNWLPCPGNTNDVIFNLIYVKLFILTTITSLENIIFEF